MTTVIRPTWKPTDEDLAALERTQAKFDQADQALAEAWQNVQALRDRKIPDLEICERIRQVTKPTLNRKLGPRKAKEA